MSFPADVPVGHCAGLETSHDRCNRFNFFNSYSIATRLEIHQPSQRVQSARPTVDFLTVFFERVVISRAAGILKFVDSLRPEEMKLAILSELVLATGFQSKRCTRLERGAMT